MKQVLIYDLNTAPVDMGIEMDKVLGFYREENIIVWDSSKATDGQNCKPQVVLLEDGIEPEVLDLHNKSGMTRFEELTRSITREDVESLGYVFTEDDNGVIKFKKYDFELHTCLGFEDGRKYYFTIINHGKICFQGRLRNKPELMKVLIQVTH